MKKILLAIAVLVSSLEAYSGAALNPHDDHAISTACKILNPTDSLGSLMCWREATAQLEANQSIDTVVASVCEKMVNIKSDAVYFERCFQASLSGAVVPAGYPHLVGGLCAKLHSRVFRNDPQARLKKSIQCTETTPGRASEGVKMLCLDIWKFSHGEDSLIFNDGTLQSYKNRVSQLMYGANYDFDIKSGKLSAHPSDALQGHITKLTGDKIEFATRYAQSWSFPEIANYRFDLASGAASISTSKYLQTYKCQ